MSQQLQILQTVLGNTISHVAQVQQQSERDLLQLAGQPGFMNNLLQITMSNDVSPNIRHAAVIYLKNFVQQRWKQNDTTSISAQDKSFMIKHILEAIVQAPNILRLQLCSILHTIIVGEYPVNWPTLVDEILQLMKSNNINSTYASLLILQELLRTYKFSFEDVHRTSINNIVSRTFPILIELGNHISQDQTGEQGEFFAHMRLTLAKIFWNALSLGTPTFFFSRPEEFGKWMNLFMNLYKKPVPADKDEQSPNWKLVKWIGHISYRLLMMYIHPTVIEVNEANAEATKKFSEMFLDKFAVPWLTLNVALLEAHNKGEKVVPKRILSLALTFLHGAIQGEGIFERTLKPQTQYIIQNIVFPFISFNAADAEMWENDPQEYLREAFEVDSSEDLFSPKAAAASVIIDLIKVRKQHTFPIYLQIITSELNKMLQQAPKDRNYALKDGILYSIGCLGSVLKKNKLTKNSLENMLATHVFPEFENPIGFIRARSAWILGQFSNIKWSSAEMMMTAMKKVMNCLGDSQLPVKIMAGLSLTDYLSSPEAMQEVKPLLPQLLQIYMNNLDEMEHDAVVKSMELLIDAFREEMEPYALTIIQKMSATFLKLMDDEDAEDEAEFVMLSCLRTMLTLMGALARKEHLFPAIEKIVYPIVYKILEDEGGLEFISEGLEILTVLTYHGESISQDLWNLFPLLGETYKQYAYDYIYEFVAPIDNYVSKQPDAFLSKPINIEIVMYMIQSYLGNESSGAEKEMQNAAKLASILLQHLRGKIDSVIPKLLELIIGRLSQAKTVALKILLLDCVADALIYNTELVLHYMENTKCTASVFGLWLNTLPSFKRIYDKKVTVLGLTAVISRDVASLPVAIQNNVGQIIVTCVKMLMQMHVQRIEEVKEREELEKEREQLLNGEFGLDSDDEDGFDDPEIRRQLHGDDEDGIDISSLQQSKTFKQLLAKISQTSWDGQNDDDELDDIEEEDGEFNSGVDDMNENALFGAAVKSFADKYADPFRQIVSKLDANEQSALQQLMNGSA